MAKYYALYKCPMCSREFTPIQPIELNEDDIPKLLGQFVSHQQFLGSVLYDAPMYLPHKCGNGDGGLGQFIGFRNVDSYVKRVNKSIPAIRKLLCKKRM